MENPGANQLVDVVVEHEYVAAQEDELTLRRGDVVRLAERRAGGWMCGELRGRTGLFPDNFVRVIGASHDLPQDLILRNSVPRFCRAVFSYQQANPDELSLCVGDVIQVLGEVEEGWWRGQKGQLRGVFPSNFVVPEPAPPPLLPPKPIREQCRVLFPYTAANGDELTLGEGDIVTIVSRDVPDQGWWRGELHGRIGLFPDNFVTVLPVPYIPGSVSPADTNKKPGRPAKNLTSNKNQPVSMNRKDSTSSKSSVGSAHENVAAVRKSLEITDPPALESQKSRKSLEPAETPTNPGTRKSIDGEDAGDQKSRNRRAERMSPEDVSYVANQTSQIMSLEVEGGKPPVPVKKAGSPVAAMLSGLRQKVLAVEHRLTGQQSSPSSTDAADGSVGSKPCSGEPVLVGVSPAPSPQPPPACDSPQPDAQPQDGFDQVERTSMLNDPRAGRVKAPRRRPPSQALRDDVPLTNGGTHHTTSTDPPAENEIIKPKAREWEKHKAPWMEELKLNQAKKTSPIAEIGRSKTIATTDSASNDKGTEGTPTRLSGSSDKILDAAAGDGDKDAPANALEMSQSMTSISSRTIKIETAQEVQGRTENPLDLSKSMSSIASRSSHLETNSKVSPGELRTSVTTSSSVTLRGSVSPTPTPVTRLPTSRLSGSHLGEQQQQLQGSPARVHSVSAAQRDNYVYMAMNDEKTMLNNDVSHSHTPEQLLIAQLNERVANLEKVVEAQEARFSSALSALSARLTKEVELRNSLQAELQKLERCVTHV